MRKKSILIVFFTFLCMTMVLSSCKEKKQPSEQKIMYTSTEYTLTDDAASLKADFNDSAVYYVSKDNKLSKFETETKKETVLPVSFEEKEQVLQIKYTNKEEVVVLTVLEDNLIFYLSLYDKDGKELWKKDVTDNLKDKDLETFFYLTEDANGNIYLLNGAYHVCVWNNLGEFQFILRSDYMTSGIATIKDTVYTYSGDKDKHFLQKIDTDKQKWERVKGKDVPSAAGFNGCILGEDTEGEVIINTGTSLVTYNSKKGSSQTVLAWTDYGMVAENILVWKKVGEEFICITTDANKIKLIILSPAKEEEVAPKQVVTIGEAGTHGYIENAISEFNQINDKYTIQLVTYEGDAHAAVERQDLDLMAGKGPDIICMGAKKYREYADKGLLEDLYTYFEQDAETGKEDYLSNILTAYERNEKLYGITTGFSIDTIAMPTKYAGDKMGVTTKEFIDIVAGLPEDKKLLPMFTDKKTIFYSLITHTYQPFIDFENNTCNFEGEEFIEWINFMNSIELEEPITDPSQIVMENYVLGMKQVSSFDSYQREKIDFKEEEITYLGYPGQTEYGSYILAETAVGINSQSSNKEGAWEFIKFLLSEEKQDAILDMDLSQSCFPVRMSSLEKGFAKAMEPEYETDENGKQIEIPKATYAAMGSPEKINIYAATAEDIEKMRELITSVNVLSNGYSPIIDIILEEVAAFYEGDKSAEEVAALIQNRVETYLNETK